MRHRVPSGCETTAERTRWGRPDAVLFDFDLTLADSSAGAVECTNHALVALGLAPANPVDIGPTIGLSLSEALRLLTGIEEPEVAREFAVHFIARADQVVADMTRIYPAVPGVLRALRRASIRVGIVSTKFRYRIQRIVEAAGIDGLVDGVVGGEDVAVHKPDPAGIQTLLARLEVAPAHALYVGDHRVDALAARAAGVAFVGVLTGSTNRAAFAELGAGEVLPSVAQLPEYLARNLGVALSEP